jgi:hypothetical protein
VVRKSVEGNLVRVRLPPPAPLRADDHRNAVSNLLAPLNCALHRHAELAIAPKLALFGAGKRRVVTRLISIRRNASFPRGKRGRQFFDTFDACLTSIGLSFKRSQAEAILRRTQNQMRRRCAIRGGKKARRAALLGADVGSRAEVGPSSSFPVY